MRQPFLVCFSGTLRWQLRSVPSPVAFSARTERHPTDHGAVQHGSFGWASAQAAAVRMGWGRQQGRPGLVSSSWSLSCDLRVVSRDGAPATLKVLLGLATTLAGQLPGEGATLHSALGVLPAFGSSWGQSEGTTVTSCAVGPGRPWSCPPVPSPFLALLRRSTSPSPPADLPRCPPAAQMPEPEKVAGGCVATLE